MTTIHPTAIVEAGARLAETVAIGPFCHVGADVELGEGVVLHGHAIIAGRTAIGANTRIFPFASIGHEPQDLKYAGEESRLVIGRDSFHARSTLQQAERSFQRQPMLRISRSCLVNMRHVREVSRTPRGDFILVTAGGTTVTSSEGYREPVRQYLERLKLAPA